MTAMVIAYCLCRHADAAHTKDGCVMCDCAEFIKVSEYKTNLAKTVIVEVRGGVASVKRTPPGIEVVVVDFDNSEEGYTTEFHCPTCGDELILLEDLDVPGTESLYLMRCDNGHGDFDVSYDAQNGAVAVKPAEGH